jgi:hypothetical protein
MAENLSRRTKPVLVVTNISRKPVPSVRFSARRAQGVKQKASQNPSKPNNRAITRAETICRPEQLRHTWKSKLSGAQGQYFFWESPNKDIPETGLYLPS